MQHLGRSQAEIHSQAPPSRHGAPTKAPGQLLQQWPLVNSSDGSRHQHWQQLRLASGWLGCMRTAEAAAAGAEVGSCAAVAMRPNRALAKSASTCGLLLSRSNLCSSAAWCLSPGSHQLTLAGWFAWQMVGTARRGLSLSQAGRLATEGSQHVSPQHEDSLPSPSPPMAG